MTDPNPDSFKFKEPSPDRQHDLEVAVGYLRDAVKYLIAGDAYTAKRQLDHADASLARL